jgi:putative membrane protein
MVQMKESWLLKLASAFVFGLWGINAISLFGYGVFSLNPQNLAWHPSFPAIFAASYTIFAQAQIYVGFLALAFVLWHQFKSSWVLPFLSVALISFGFEFAGTTTGLPFGYYYYTDHLGPKILDHVPWSIPVSWFTMGLASYGLTLFLFKDTTLLQDSSSQSRLLKFRFLEKVNWSRVNLGALFLTSWDLLLDPAMSYATPFWIWEEPGFFYGMPALNLFGWFVTSWSIMLFFDLIRFNQKVEKLQPKYVLHVYGGNLALPLGMSVLAGLWLSLVAITIFWVLIALLRKRSILSPDVGPGFA